MSTIEYSGFPRVATSFLTHTPVASSASGDFIATNISILDRPKKVWRSTATGSQNIVLDFAAAKTPPAIFLDAVNFATVQIQGNATDLWTSPSFDSGSVTIIEDAEIDRYKKLIMLTAFNYRYMRILIPSQTPIDGAGFYSIGAVAVPSTLTTLSTAPGYPAEWMDINSILQNEFLSGGFETIPLSSGKAKTFKLNWKTASDDAEIKELYDNFGDRNKIILYDFNQTVDWEAYLCKVTSDLKRKQSKASPVEFPNITFRVFA